MNDYRNFEAVDFAQDDHFFKWVKHPALYPELDRFWKRWMDENPEKAREIQEARLMIMAVLEEGEAVHINSRQEAVLSRLRTSINSIPVPKRKLEWRKVSAIAATGLVLLSVGLFYFFQRSPNRDAVVKEADGAPYVMEINNGEVPKKILLADGSSVVLQPKSTLQYPYSFEQDVREVTLTGEGFFDVTKDINKPFVVYTDKVLTKVLGTSFTIRAFSDGKDILVKVRTGKVSVVERGDDNEAKTSDNAGSNGVLLAPNQQVIFFKDESKFVKSLVDEPAILNSIGRGNFTYTDTPVSEVFAILEEAYGVDIVFDEELMRECLLNGSFEDMPLYDKLRLICKSVNAQYELVDSNIVVAGRGCREQ